MSRHVLLLCHSYEAPFLRVAEQYAALFRGTEYSVVTVFLKGPASIEVAKIVGSHKTIFLDKSNSQLNGLKLNVIRDIRQLHQKYHFEFAIAHRYKSIYIASHVKNLFVIGVAHIDGVFKNKMRKLFIYLHQKKLVLFGVSKAIRDDIRSNLPLLNTSKTFYLYNSLDFNKIKSEQFDRDEARRVLGLSNQDYLFLNTGRLHEDKDQTTLINAFADCQSQLPQAKLVIAGKGRLEKQLKDLVTARNISDKVIFLGMVPELYKYIRAFDGFVLTSIREGLPVALLEAFAAEIPCIASLCNGSTEAIENAGLSFEVGDVNGLSNCMKQIYALSNSQKEEMKKSMQAKVASNYTEIAVRHAFWNFPFMKKYQ